jgi:hypothetical protein
MDARTALKHPWMVNRDELTDEKPTEAVLASIENGLLQYPHTSELKKLALNVIAHRSTTSEIMDLRKAFDKFDIEKDGVITYAEFKQALHEMNYPEETLKEIFRSVVRRMSFALVRCNVVQRSLTHVPPGFQ